MKITVITSSPRRRGTSALLADNFIDGAKEVGHQVFRFDAAFEELHPCVGCGTCGHGSDKCVWHDGMEKLNPHLLEADLVVFVTPVYFLSMTAQLKMVFDRFYANSPQLHHSRKKAILLATAGASDFVIMQNLLSHYQAILQHMGWQEAGLVLATGVVEREDIENSVYPKAAYQLGKDLLISK